MQEITTAIEIHATPETHALSLPTALPISFWGMKPKPSPPMAVFMWMMHRAPMVTRSRMDTFAWIVVLGPMTQWWPRTTPG